MSVATKLMLVIACLTSGCAAGMSTDYPSTGDSSEKVATTSSTLELQGDWRGLCHDGQEGGTFSRQLHVLNDRLSYQQFEYSDAACGTLSSIVTLDSQIRVGDVIPNHPSARQLDEQIVSSTVEVLSAAAADHFNHVALCGLSDWHVGDSRDMSACPAMAGMAFGQGVTIYATYVRNDDKQLQVSDGSHGSELTMAMVPADRPTAPTCDGYCAYFKYDPNSATE